MRPGADSLEERIGQAKDVALAGGSENGLRQWQRLGVHSRLLVVRSCPSFVLCLLKGRPRKRGSKAAFWGSPEERHSQKDGRVMGWSQCL